MTLRFLNQWLYDSVTEFYFIQVNIFLLYMLWTNAPALCLVCIVGVQLLLKLFHLFLSVVVPLVLSMVYICGAQCQCFSVSKAFSQEGQNSPPTSSYSSWRALRLTCILRQTVLSWMNGHTKLNWDRLGKYVDFRYMYFYGHNCNRGAWTVSINVTIVTCRWLVTSL